MLHVRAIVLFDLHTTWQTSEIVTLSLFESKNDVISLAAFVEVLVCRI